MRQENHSPTPPYSNATISGSRQAPILICSAPIQRKANLPVASRNGPQESRGLADTEMCNSCSRSRGSFSTYSRSSTPKVSAESWHEMSSSNPVSVSMIALLINSGSLGAIPVLVVQRAGLRDDSNQRSLSGLRFPSLTASAICCDRFCSPA